MTPPSSPDPAKPRGVMEFSGRRAQILDPKMDHFQKRFPLSNAQNTSKFSACGGPKIWPPSKSDLVKLRVGSSRKRGQGEAEDVPTSPPALVQDPPRDADVWIWPQREVDPSWLRLMGSVMQYRPEPFALGCSLRPRSRGAFKLPWRCVSARSKPSKGARPLTQTTV